MLGRPDPFQRLLINRFIDIPKVLLFAGRQTLEVLKAVGAVGGVVGVLVVGVVVVVLVAGAICV